MQRQPAEAKFQFLVREERIQEEGALVQLESYMNSGF